MQSKKINQLATELAPDLTDITIIGDPSTGISKKITLSQMASLFTGTVEEYTNFASFPLVGTADTIYISLATNVLYRWDTTLAAYVELSPNIISNLVFGDGSGFDGTISLVGSTATLTITTALTTGSVPYIGSLGALNQDNANHFWDATNKRLGLGTNAPTVTLDTFGSGIIGRLNGTTTNNAFLGFASAGTNKWSIGNVQSDHRFRIYSEANTAELVSVLQTGEFGIGIANPLTKLHIFGGATALIANLDANTSVAKSISFRSGNSSRINLEVSGTESGSNVGADLFVRTYTDLGALIETPLSIVRSTGITTIKSLMLTNALSIANGGTGSTTQNFVDLSTTQSIAGAKTFSGITTISNATVSSSTTTGALIITGGIGIGGSLFGTTGVFNGLLNTTVGNGISAGGNSFAVSPSSTRGVININGSTDQFLTLGSNGYLVGSSTLVRILSTPDFDIAVGGSQRLLIASSGGKATFSNALAVKAGYAGDKFLFTGAGSGDALGVLYDNAGAAKIQLYTNGNSYFTGGNVGIGTDTPSARLSIANSSCIVDITSTTSTSFNGLEFKNGGGSFYVGQDNSGGGFYGGSAYAGSLYTSGSVPIIFFTNTVPRMRITTGGAATELIKITNNLASGDPVNIQNLFTAQAPNNQGAQFLYCGDSAALRLKIVANGGIHNYQANNVNLSDRNTKKEIAPLDSYWNKFKDIEIVKFKYIDQTHDDFNIGVIAQQVEEVAPEFVDTSMWNLEGEEIERKAIYTSDLHHATIKVLQEAMAKIESLEAEVTILKAK